MTLLDRPATWSASELVDAFVCDHLAALEAAVAAGERERPAPSGEAAIVLRRGIEHECAYLASLARAGVAVLEIERPIRRDEYTRAAAQTREAFARGVELVANATFDVHGFVGVADLARRVAGRSRFGDWTYEAIDVKLAARSAPTAIVQLCAYSEALAAVCETPLDDLRFHLVLGDGRSETHRVAEFAAFYRTVRERFLAARRQGGAVTRPDKLAACDRCRWNAACSVERERADDLSLVARIRRDQVRALREAGIATVAQLAAAADGARPHGMAAATWNRLRLQAQLQDGARREGTHRYVFLPLEARSGFGLLPEPSAADVYFDLEGDPFVPGGLEYLFGRTYRGDDGVPRFHAEWAHDRAGERAALSEFLHFVRERRQRDPGMHVYHYAPYERTALARIALGTPDEAEVEKLFREEVFVDLYAVVRGALMLSTPNSSIKSVELFYRGKKRTSEVATAIGSVVAYEDYLRTGERARLDEIAVYNQDDCDSTLELHDWLLARRREAEGGAAPVAAAASEDESRARADDDAELDALRAELAGQGSSSVLLGDLLEYHRREQRPMWREYFARCEAPADELLDDPKCLAGLRPVDGFTPYVEKSSLVYALVFPPQRHGLRAGEKPDDPATQRGAGEILEIAAQADGSGILLLKRSKRLSTTALPTALVPKESFSDDEQRKALRRFARRLAHGEGERDAQRALLDASPPRFRSRRERVDDGRATPERLAELAADLDRSVLVVQGPPGTGKTWIAARAIVALLAGGYRIGVAAGTHKAINNLLAEIARVAKERNAPLCARKKSNLGFPESHFDPSGTNGAIVDETDAKAFPFDPSVRLLAGTPALFAREAMEGAVDLLFVDEAGQLALADALAIGRAASALVLLGDPQQLPHVSAGLHPAGADASALGHLLGGASTVPPERGLFLPASYRMHATIARFVSDLMYDGRLASDASCTRQRIIAPGSGLDGAGLRTLALEHAGCSNASVAEASAIAAALGRLDGARLVDAGGRERELVLARDAIVVAPYNAQVALVRETLAANGLGAVRVGTVDKFQGQEAAIVLYSMTTSSGEDVPRDVEFLFDRHRLNVAISRARALAVIVYSTQLLALRPATVEQMRLANALARFGELAESAAPAP